MITIFTKEYNTFSQIFYDNLISHISLNSLKCPCCKHSSCFVFHAYYTRNVIIGLDLKVILKITRVKCKECHTTHALMPSSIIPYYQIPLKNIATAAFLHLKCLNNFEIFKHIPTLDETNLRHLLKVFLTFWYEKLISFNISLNSLEQLVKECFSNFLTQFMQISHIYNILYIDST